MTWPAGSGSHQLSSPFLPSPPLPQVHRPRLAYPSGPWHPYPYLFPGTFPHQISWWLHDRPPGRAAEGLGSALGLAGPFPFSSTSFRKHGSSSIPVLPALPYCCVGVPACPLVLRLAMALDLGPVSSSRAQRHRRGRIVHQFPPYWSVLQRLRSRGPGTAAHLRSVPVSEDGRKASVLGTER